MQDAKPGPVENVLNVQPDGILMLQESADQSLINADPGPQLVNASHVIQVT